MAAFESLEDCISRLPAALQDKPVTNLNEIAESFTNWEPVLPYLGLVNIPEDYNKAITQRLVGSHLSNVHTCMHACIYALMHTHTHTHTHMRIMLHV